MFGFVRTESKFIALVARRHVLTAVIFHVRSCSLKLAIHLITSSSHTGRTTRSPLSLSPPLPPLSVAAVAVAVATIAVVTVVARAVATVAAAVATVADAADAVAAFTVAGSLNQSIGR